MCIHPLRRAIAFLIIAAAFAGSDAAVEEVNTTPLALQPAVAFPKLQWAGWSAENDSGILTPIRPILVTHAGDGTNRVFVPEQHGVIYVLPNDQNGTKADVFLDIKSQGRLRRQDRRRGLSGAHVSSEVSATTAEFFVYLHEQGQEAAEHSRPLSCQQGRPEQGRSGVGRRSC